MTAGILPDMKIAGLCLFFSNVFFVVFPSCVYGQSTAQIKGVIWGPQKAVMAGTLSYPMSAGNVRARKKNNSGTIAIFGTPISTNTTSKFTEAVKTRRRHKKYIRQAPA